MPFKDQEKNRENYRRWYQANKERVRESARRWYQANKERVMEYNKIHQRLYWLERDRKSAIALDDRYVRRAIHVSSDLSYAEIPQFLVDMKREHLRLKRKLKEIEETA
jgi:hypothetical protein